MMTAARACRALHQPLARTSLKPIAASPEGQRASRRRRNDDTAPEGPG